MKKIISLTLIATLLILCLSSCGETVYEYGTGACTYATSRDVSDRDVVYVDMAFEGYGKILILLDRTTAPITVDNFVSLVNDGFYDGLTIHRIQQNFVIQGGDPDGTGGGGSENKIYGEFASNGHYNNIKHLRGVISMARSSDPDSASSQFFICNADAKSLNGDYASFGYVIKGMSIIDAITSDYVAYATGTNGTITNKSKQPKIVYAKVVDYTPEAEG